MPPDTWVWQSVAPKSNRSKWIIYGGIPLGVSLVLQAMYFSGNLALQRIICPKLPPLHIGSYREFGLLENLQNVVLVAIIGCFVAGVFRATHERQRLVFALLAVFSAWVLLEEMDYGTHIHAYLTADQVAGWFLPADSPEFQALVSQTDMSVEPFNIHNRGDITDIIKVGVSVLMFFLFIVAPLMRDRIKNPWLRYITPDRFVFLTIAVIVVMRFLTHLLGDLDRELYEAARKTPGASRELGAMGANLSEFRELPTYYLFLLYVAAVVFFEKAPVAADSAKASAKATVPQTQS